MDILIFDNNINIKYSKKTFCDNCNKKYNKLFNLKNNNTNIDICKLCTYVLIYKPENTNKILLLKSDLDQTKIIKDTDNFYYTHNRLPMPNEIDPNVQRLNFSSIILAELINNYQEVRDNTKNIKIFATDQHLFPKNLLLEDKNSTELYWENINNLNIYNFDKEIIKLFDKYIEKLDNIKIQYLNENKKEYDKLINNSEYKKQINNFIENL